MNYCLFLIIGCSGMGISCTNVDFIRMTWQIMYKQFFIWLFNKGDIAIMDDVLSPVAVHLAAQYSGSEVTSNLV